MLRLALRLVLLWAVARALFTLNLDKDSVIFWELDYDREEFIVEFHTKNSGRIGWVGVGFSNNGNISDGSADYCVAWRNHLVGPEAPYQITDVHVANGTVLLEPDVQQDCSGFQYLQQNDTIKWTFRRKFVTCDTQDYAVEEGTTHLHWITGDGPLYDIKGVSLASAVSSGFKRVRFLKNVHPLPPVNSRTAVSVDILNEKVKVQPVETTYWCHIVKLPEAFKEKHHIVQFEANIQAGNEELVHHMEVFHCETDVDVDIPAYSGPCEQTPKEISVCSRVIGAWAMGAEPLRYPAQAGFPIGGPNFNPYVRLEIHYNNPELKSDWIDSSGMRFWVTKKLRKYDAGVMELGLEYTDKMAIPPAFDNFQLTGICNHECTSVGLPKEGVTVFASQLHTHLTGTRVFTRHFRRLPSSKGHKGYVELPPMNYDNHYSTHYQEIRQLKNPTTVLPGDILLTSCEFDTRERAEITLGGFAISEEMCVNYIHYYPRAQLEVCKSSVSWKSLRDYFHFMARMEGQSIEPEGAVSANYKGIKWTPFRSRLLEDFYNLSPIDMQCNRSDGRRFPGSWDAMPQVKLPALMPRPDLNAECLADESGRMMEGEKMRK